MNSPVDKNEEYKIVIFIVSLVFFLLATAIASKYFDNQPKRTEKNIHQTVSTQELPSADINFSAISATNDSSSKLTNQRTIQTSKPEDQTSWWEKAIFHVLSILVIDREIASPIFFADNFENSFNYQENTYKSEK